MPPANSVLWQEGPGAGPARGSHRSPQWMQPPHQLGGFGGLAVQSPASPWASPASPSLPTPPSTSTRRATLCVFQEELQEQKPCTHACSRACMHVHMPTPGIPRTRTQAEAHAHASTHTCAPKAPERLPDLVLPGDGSGRGSYFWGPGRCDVPAFPKTCLQVDGSEAVTVLGLFCRKDRCVFIM